MATSPPISPTVVTPLAHRKRRHSEMARSHIDLTANDAQVVANGEQAVKAATTQEASDDKDTNRKIEDEDDSDEVTSSIEDFVDTAELEPYQPVIEGEMMLKPEVAAKLRSRLLRLGPTMFFEQYLLSEKYSPALLGTAFGLDPNLEQQIGEDLFLQILGQLVKRSYFKRQKLPQYNTIDDVAELLRKSSNILVITGAGISTSLGIPDFRSKETGFYSKLLAEGINEPEEVFDIGEFDYDPSTFYRLANGILPDLNRHSPTHGFIRLLQDKGKLQTNYTQNIDNLEELAGIEKRRLIQCHGSFATATCRKCNYKVKGTAIFPDIKAQRVARCKRCLENVATREATPKKKFKLSSNRFSNDDDESEEDDIPQPGVMKPDITFFGEKLPDDFFDRFTDRDVKTVDLVLVIGTSLKVAPVSEMPNYLPHNVPHVYISREPIEHVNFDVQLLGNCDDVVYELCKRTGWELKHEMIPKDCEVEVKAVEDSVYRWRIGPQATQVASENEASEVNDRGKGV